MAGESAVTTRSKVELSLGKRRRKNPWKALLTTLILRESNVWH